MAASMSTDSFATAIILLGGADWDKSELIVSVRTEGLFDVGIITVNSDGILWSIGAKSKVIDLAAAYSRSILKLKALTHRFKQNINKGCLSHAQCIMLAIDSTLRTSQLRQEPSSNPSSTSPGRSL